MSEPMTFTAYAKHRGVSQPYISQQVAAGVIPLVAGRKIDPDAADAALDALRDPSKAGVAARHAAARGAKNAPPEPPAPEVERPLGGAPTGQFHKAKTATEVFRAKTAQLEYERAIGRLIESDTAIRALNANLGPTIKLLESIPNRIASRLAAESDPRKVHALLASEIDAVRGEIARIAQQLAEQLGAAQQ